MIHISHLKGEKVFGLAKHYVNCLHGANGDSHKPNNVNFSHLGMASMLLVPIMFKMFPPTQCLSLHIMFFQYFLEVGWS
jgi:hypothetical protein